MMVFAFYPYLLESDNLCVFISHNFERTRNIIFRKLGQQYANTSTFVDRQPWQEHVLKRLSFTQLMTIANDLKLLLKASPHPSDEAYSRDHRRANLHAWTIKVFMSSLEGRTREQWLTLLR